MPKTIWQFISLIWIASLLVGCQLSRPPQGPQPAQILIFDGATTRTLGPDHASYPHIARKLDELVAAMDTPLYAHYPPERVATEIAALPHLEAIYDRNVTLAGKGYQVNAERLIVVVAHGEKMILTHDADRTNWDACEESKAARFDALMKTVKEQTGVDLLVIGQ